MFSAARPKVEFTLILTPRTRLEDTLNLYRVFPMFWVISLMHCTNLGGNWQPVKFNIQHNMINLTIHSGYHKFAQRVLHTSEYWTLKKHRNEAVLWTWEPNFTCFSWKPLCRMTICCTTFYISKSHSSMPTWVKTLPSLTQVTNRQTLHSGRLLIPQSKTWSRKNTCLLFWPDEPI